MTAESLRGRARTGVGALLIVLLVSVSAWAESVRVKADRTSVWGNTTGTAGVIGTVRRGDILEVISHDGRWLFVVLPSDPRQRGYVLEQQTEPVADTARETGAAPATPQSRPAQRPAPTARPRTPKAPPFLYLGVTGQASPLDFTRRDSVTTLLESETRTTEYTPSRRPGFEFAIGQEVRRNLIVSATLAATFGPGTAAVSADIPHPIFYATPRTLSGETTARRTETALHIEVAKVLHRSRSYTLTFGVGPSVFFVKQALLDQLEYDETYPYDTVTFTGASMTDVSASAFGAHLQVDFAKPFRRSLSWQVSGRYSYGEAKLKRSETTTRTKAGQAQVSAGLRASF